MDSTNTARKRFSDSLTKVRNHRTDSLEAVRKYKNSNRYKDSVADARAHVADSIREERQMVMTMEREERQRITDSVTSIRQRSMDSLKTVQKRRSDSLEVVRKYKESRRYSDSVGVVRERRMDSLTAMRKHINDSIASVRKRITDSTSASRKHILDSTTAARKVISDSLTAARKVKTDSLAVVKEKREKQQKQAAKDREKKLALAAEIKFKSKQEAWNNKKMLKKKWSVPRQVIQNSFTRYNYYFNASNKMKEATANMQRVNRENLDSFIALYPFNPDRDSAQIAPDMDSVIRKVSLGIQIHDPRTKWADDLYLLLGQAYYYKGDYKNASNSFRYIIGMEQRVKKKKGSGSAPRPKGQAPSIVQEEKESALDFLKHKSVNNEAILWLSRTFVQMGQPEGGEAVLDMVASDPKFPENMKGELAMAKAYLALNNGNIKDAAPQLQIAANDPYLDNEQRQRAAYLSAQIFQQENDYTASTDNFQKVVDLHPNIEMDFYARKNMAMNAINSGEKREESISSLKKILKDYKYAGYYEQVYFILGRLSSKSGQNDEAIAYLQKSVSSAKTTKKQKAISFAALGDIYYHTGDYVSAKNYYDSSALLAKNAPDDNSVMEAVRLSNALTTVTGPYLTIKTNDSLLALASLSEKEQRSAIREHLRTLIRAREDSLFNAENGGVNSVAQNEGNMNIGGGGGWYFANSTQMTKGKNEFKRVWGNRPLVDNWRRMSEIGFVSTSNNSQEPTEVEDENGLLYDENGLPTEESLLAMLPRDAERQQKIHRQIQKAYVDLSDAYIMQLEDYNLADRALDTLDVRYKDHADKARELYLRYIMSMRMNQVQEARSYAQQIQIQYPNSEYATLVKPTEDNIGLPTNSNLKETVANYYDATYSLLMQRQFTEVLQRISTARQLYKDKKYEKRFAVMEGVALAGAGNFAKADTLLNNFIKGNGKDTLVAWAEEVLKYVNKNKPVAPKVDSLSMKTKIDTAVTKAPPIVNTNTNLGGTVEIAKPTGEVPKMYAYKPDAEHYVLISFPGMDARAMGMKAAVGDLNSFKFKNDNLSSGIDMLSQKDGVVVVKKFSNAAQAKGYIETLKATGQLFREYQSSEYQLFSISASNYQKLLNDHSIPQYLNFYKFYYK